MLFETHEFFWRSNLQMVQQNFMTRLESLESPIYRIFKAYFEW